MLSARAHVCPEDTERLVDVEMASQETDGSSVLQIRPRQCPSIRPYCCRFRNPVDRFFNENKHFMASAARFETLDANDLTLANLAAGREL
jgi:hypothetical protein